MPLSFAPTYDDPDVFLALNFSVPFAAGAPHNYGTTFVVDVDEDVRITIPRPERHSLFTARLFTSKEGIAFALLLRQLLEMGHDEVLLRRKLRDFAREAYTQAAERESRFLRTAFPTEEAPFLSPARFLQSVDVAPDFLEEVDQLTFRVLRFLEDEQLVIDPWVTGTAGMMVLLGMVPVRWSVRTPKGQRVYREISIRAGLWTLDIHRIRQEGKSVTDWDFHFRGVNTVKHLIKGLSEDFLATEQAENEHRRRPNLPSPRRIDVE